jgi:hypothetical protein
MTAIDYFSNTDTVRIATELRDGGEVVTPIWAVVVDAVPYVRSAYGPQAKWYRRAQRAGRAAFVDGAHRYPVTIENVDDEETNARVDEAYRTKYADEGEALQHMVVTPARACTMRIIPAD